MPDNDIAPMQLSVRSANPALPRAWTNLLCSLTANGIRYTSLSNPDKVLLLIDLEGIEFIGNYDTGKSEPGFQVKSNGLTTLHKCADTATVQHWVDKVMTAKLGPSKGESDPEDSLSSDMSEGASASGDGVVVVEAARKSDKSEEKAKAKLKSSGEAKAKSKSKTEPSSGKKAKRDKKDKKEKESKKSKQSASAKENEEKSPKRSSKSAAAPAPTTSGSYVPQWAAHYNGIKQQERQKHLESLSTQELVKLASGGLEQEAKAEKERVLQQWAVTKRAKLLELHALELADLQKKQQRELDDIAKRAKEFMDQA